MNKRRMKGEPFRVEDVAASAQEAIVKVLAAKAVRAADELGLDTIVLAGGVAANQALRSRVEQLAPAKRVVYPSPVFCTDNAAMIGAAALPKFARGEFTGLDLNAQANLPLYF